MIPHHLYYLFVDLGCVLFPFIFSFYKKMPFYKNWKALGIATVAMMLLFIPWDILFTHKGIWGFNEKYLTGNYIFNLPIEEWFFFICIPYACVFTYESFRYFFPNLSSKYTGRKWSLFYILLLIPITLIHWGHWYTFTTGILSILALFLVSFVFKFKHLATFHLSWLVLLIPFYLSNGILTGLDFTQYAFINPFPENITDQIVWYNNAHNLGIRIWSVPLDDFFYGMLMLLIAIPVYERFKSNEAIQAQQQ